MLAEAWAVSRPLQIFRDFGGIPPVPHPLPPGDAADNSTLVLSC